MVRERPVTRWTRQGSPTGNWRRPGGAGPEGLGISQEPGKAEGACPPGGRALGAPRRSGAPEGTLVCLVCLLVHFGGERCVCIICRFHCFI